MKKTEISLCVVIVAIVITGNLKYNSLKKEFQTSIESEKEHNSLLIDSLTVNHSKNTKLYIKENNKLLNIAKEAKTKIKEDEEIINSRDYTNEQRKMFIARHMGGAN